MTQPHTLPEDWQPTPGDIAYAKSRGICEAQASEIAENIKAYYTQNAKGMKAKWKEWHGGGGVWGTWIRREHPWPVWKAEKAEAEAERERKLNESHQLMLGMGKAAERLNRPKARPRANTIPELGRLGPQGRQRIIDRIAADEPERPKAKVKPAYVPMPDHLRGTILAPKEVKR